MSSAPWWGHALVLVLLLAVSAGVYQRTFHLGFFSLDDPDYVESNPHLENLTGSNLRAILSEPYFANYAPLHLLSYALDVALAGGKSATAFHISNVIWYCWVVGMVYLLALTLRLPLAAAAGAALLFALHPAHVEVVAWISSRKDLVATGFAALAMTCYLRYRQPGAGARAWYAGSVLCFLLASAAKQSVVLLPAALLVWDFLVERRRHWAMALDKIPFGLVTLFFAWRTLGAQPDTAKAFSTFIVGATQWQNLWLLTGLGDYVLYRPAPDPQAGHELVRILVIVSAVGFWLLPLALLRVLRPTQVGLIYWTLIQMTPPMVMRFITPVTDRYLFLPSVGVCLLLANCAAGWAGAAAPKKRWAIAVPLATVALIWAAKTWNYLGEWRDPRTVWFGAKAKSESYQISELLGKVYQEAGDRMNAFITSGKAPKLADDLPLALSITGDAAQVEKLRTEWEGQPQDQSATRAYRDHLWELAWQEFGSAVANRGTVLAPNLYLRRGKLRVDQGKPAEAIADLKRAFELARTHTYEKVRQENGTHVARALGIAYWQMRDYAEALRWYQEAKRIQDASPTVWLPAINQEVERITRLAEGSK